MCLFSSSGHNSGLSFTPHKLHPINDSALSQVRVQAASGSRAVSTRNRSLTTASHLCQTWPAKGLSLGATTTTSGPKLLQLSDNMTNFSPPEPSKPIPKRDKFMILLGILIPPECPIHNSPLSHIVATCGGGNRRVPRIF